MDEKKEQLERLFDVLGTEKVNSLAKAVCQQVIGKGLSFRQAETVLDYAKSLLKEARI